MKVLRDKEVPPTSVGGGRYCAVMAAHVFVDETKERGYLVAGVVVPANQVDACRRTIRGLIMPRQRRIHFKGESNARRNQIMEVIAALGVRALIYDASRYPDPKQARDVCLIQLVQDLAEIGAHRLVLEAEDAALKSDKVLLYVQLRKAGLDGTLRYVHLRPHEECLLALPDAIAWCWAKGGHWRARVNGMGATVKSV